MVRKILSAVLLVAIGLTTVVSMCDTEDGIIADEKRKRASFPDLPKKLRRSEVKQYTDGIERFFLDRVALREKWLMLASVLPIKNKDPQYIEGREDWLYLGNAHGSYEDRITGRDVDTPENVAVKTKIFRGLQDVCERNGVAFYIMMGPNKASVYPEYLPSVTQPAPQRYSDPLLASLKEAGVHVFDPTDLLKASKDKGCLYWKMDTHWNQYGSYIATQAFMEYCGLPSLPKCTFRLEGEHQGDIYDVACRWGMKPATGDNYAMEYEELPPEGLSDKKILVLGDSFSEMPIEHLKHVFPHLRHKHYGYALLLPTSQRELLPLVLEQYLSTLPEKPDVLLWIHVERFFADGFFRSPTQVFEELQS